MFDLLLREASPQAVAGQLRLLASEGVEQGLMPVPHLASLYGNEAVLRWCVEHSKTLGAKGRAQAKKPQEQQVLFDLANDRDRAGATALHYAALGGHLTCVRLLVEEAHVPPDTTVKSTARERNLIDGHTDVSSVITTRTDATSPIGASGITPLHFACRAGAQDVVDYIYQRWLDGQHRGASKKGQRPPALPVDEHGATPLAYAIQGGHTDLVRHLIAPTAPSSPDASSTDGGVDGNAEAAAAQSEPGLGWAISMAKNSGSKMMTLLSLAMSAGWVEIARLLITEVKRRDKRKLRAFVTQRMADGTQLLHSACYFGSVECVDLLLSLRDDVTGSRPFNLFNFFL
jgi:ankyrin repeat protein